MSGDPIEDAYRSCMGIFSSTAVLVIKLLLPIIIIFLIISYILLPCLAIAVVVATCYGIVFFFQALKFERGRFDLTQLCCKNPKLFFAILWETIRNACRLVKNWKAGNKSADFVNPGDDTPPPLAYSFIKALPGPLWFKLFMQAACWIFFFFTTPGILLGFVITLVVYETIAFGNKISAFCNKK